MNILDFAKKINIPILVLDKDGNFIMINSAFKLLFKDVTLPQKIQKFKNSFTIPSCILYDENITNYNPIDLALEIKNTCKISTQYQKSSYEFLNIIISVNIMEDYFVFEFSNNTDSISLEELKEEKTLIESQLSLTKKENAQYLKTKDEAQVQAIKMALLNRIFEALRQSIDLDETLNYAFKELTDILGLSKVGFAFFDDNLFTVKNIYPEKYKNEIETNINIDSNSLKQLQANKFVISNVISDDGNNNMLQKAQARLLCPIYHTNRLLGTIVGFLPQKNLANINNDMINAISAQFTSAIVQGYLFQELNSKNEQLQNALTKLEETQLQLINSEKMASLGQLVAGVAHEINTPLASINSNNSLFEKCLSLNNFDEDIIDTLKSMIDTDKEAIKRIANIVKSLKRFVRLDEAELQDADINKELDLTLELLKHETKKRIEIVKNYGAIGEIKCYPNLLNQVFMNILMNGIQSIEDKGTIYISTSANNGTLKISIKDTGSGMDEKTKEKIFKTGFTTKKIGIGTGLGLMISKDIIEKHSGSISFSSTKNVGTEFTISIPIISQKG